MNIDEAMQLKKQEKFRLLKVQNLTLLKLFRNKGENINFVHSTFYSCTSHRIRPLPNDFLRGKFDARKNAQFQEKMPTFAQFSPP